MIFWFCQKLSSIRKRNKDMLYKAIFDRSMEEQKPLSVLTSSDETDFWFGIIRDYNNEVVEMRLFDSYGEFDGYVVMPTDDVSGVEYDDEYEMVTAYLIAENSFMTHFPDSILELNEANWRYQLLGTLMDKKIPVELEVGEKTRMGYLEHVGLEDFTMRLFDTFGDNRGKVICDLDAVSCIRYWSKKVKKGALLFDWRNKGK